VGSLLKPLLKKVTTIVGSRMLWLISILIHSSPHDSSCFSLFLLAPALNAQLLSVSYPLCLSLSCFFSGCLILINLMYQQASHKVEEPVLESLSFKQLSMAWIDTCLRNVWGLKLKSVIGPLSIIGASSLAASSVSARAELHP
jgi:hypothetical protein